MRRTRCPGSLAEELDDAIQCVMPVMMIAAALATRMTSHWKGQWGGKSVDTCTLCGTSSHGNGHGM